MKNKIFIPFFFFMIGNLSLIYGQTVDNILSKISDVSSAPVSFRVNESGSKLHGYYKKGYNLTIYGDSSVIGYRADCDKDDDWSGAKKNGTTQTSNSFESIYRCVFNPHELYGTVLPGNKKGQNHFDELKKLKIGIGDLTITYKLGKNNKLIDSVIGVVFDRGPHNQPGESSVAICTKFKNTLDNNQFIYIVFPNTANYIKKITGTMDDKIALKRNPTNVDFQKAYIMMLNDRSANDMTENLKSLLSQISIVTNFDNATPQEKAQAKLKPKNDNRNLND